MRYRLALFCATAFAVAIAGCRRDDDLAEGATDAPSSNTGASTAGPGAPPVDSAGPGAGDTMSQPTPAAAPAGPTVILVQQGPHAPYVATAAGAALYWVDGDTDGGTCTGACLQSWPALTVEGVQPSGGPGLQGAMIATITRADGARQVTFDGHPLYRYTADAGTGATNGDGVTDKFGRWHLAKAPASTPAGTAAAMDAAASGNDASAPPAR